MQTLLQHILSSLGMANRQPVQASPPEPPSQRIAQRIAIAGVSPATASAAFIRGYGIEPTQVIDVGVATPETVAAETTDALSHVYTEGGTRGPDTAAIANGIRTLAPGEALYFVLTGHPGSRSQALQAFVHKAEASRG